MTKRTSGSALDDAGATSSPTSSSRQPRPSSSAAEAAGFRLADRATLIVAGIVFAASLLTYLFTLAPTVTGEDSGELVSAAYTLGIPHPPGYPLWCLVAHFFTWLPFGNVAWRVNLGSAVCAALACALCVLLFVRLGVRRSIAGGAAFLMAVSTTLWSQAVITEVYALTLLTIVALFYLLVRWREVANEAVGDRWMCAAAFICALSLGTHDTILLLSPVILLFVIYVLRMRILNPLVLGKIVLSMIAGLSVFLYLPIRASAHPAMNWGDPDTWNRFWAHVTRQEYLPDHRMLSSHHTWSKTIGQMGALGNWLLEQWPWPVTVVVVLAALGGIVFLWRRDRFLAAWLTLWALVMSVGFTWLLNFGLNEEALHVAEVFFIPAWFAVLTLATFGFEAIATWRSQLQSALAGAVATLGVLSMVINWSSSTMHGNDVAHRFARDMLAALPQNAILFTSADYEAFPVKYMQIVEGFRTDVATLDCQRGIGTALKLTGLEPHVEGYIDEHDVAHLLRQSTRPIYSTTILGAVSNTAVLPVGLTYRTFNNPTDASQAAALDATAWKVYTQKGGMLSAGHGNWVLPAGLWESDWSTASILSEYEIARARSALAYQNDTSLALKLVASAATRLPRDPGHMNALGALCFRGAQVQAAIGYYKKAIKLAPRYPEARYNLISALITQGRWDEAQEAYAATRQLGVDLGDRGTGIENALLKEQEARPKLQAMRAQVAADPRDPRGWFTLALFEQEFYHLGAAERDLRQASDLAPREPAVWDALGAVLLQRNDRNGAIQAWKTALDIEPKGSRADRIRRELQALGQKTG